MPVHHSRASLPLPRPDSGFASVPTSMSQPPGNLLPASPPEAEPAAVAVPWMGMLALAFLVALGFAALRLRFSDAPAAEPPASPARAGGAAVEVPRPSLLFRRSHHEKIHDQRYLSLILEAELESSRSSGAPENGVEPPPSRD